MIPRCNLHTHTTFCDGKNTPEEMILGAIAEGCETLGFSGHSPFPFESWWGMSGDRLDGYIKEVSRLREKYKDKTEILLGLEYDLLSSCDITPFDYILGSAHYVEHNGGRVPIDDTPELLLAAVNELYGGDFLTFTRDYYASLCRLPEHTHCDIIGHFDLVKKFNEGNRFFDETAKMYKDYALEALDFLLEKELVFEINMGAVCKGYRKEPYPAPFILRYIAEKGGHVMINSDSHSAGTILFGFEDAVEYARSCGIKELSVMKNGKFQPFAI